MKDIPPELLGAGSKTTVGSAAETDIVIISGDDNKTFKPLISNYVAVTLGTNTIIDLRYYGSFLSNPTNSDWYTIFNPSTAVIGVQQVVDSPTRVTSGVLKFVDTLAHYHAVRPLPAFRAYKVTAKGNNAAADGTVTVTVLNHEA